MKKVYLIFAMALLLPLTTLAQGWPANYGGVMLQGFFWDSYKETPDCSPFGPWANHVTNEATETHQPGYTWATMYGAGWTEGEEWQVPVTTWNSLIAHKNEITPYIDLLWLPQSGSTVADSTMVYYESEDNSGRNGERPWRNGYEWGYNDGNVITNPDCMGFVPVFYFHHGLSYNPDGTPWTYTDSKGRTWTPISYFGTEAELRQLIATYKAEGTGAIEDVVANHRGGLGTWADDKYSIEFPTEWYQGTFSPEGELVQWTSDDVCIDDESGRGTGNPDCGGKGEWARDIDHHSPATRAKVIKFLDFLKNDLGYVGYRYDYAMGFEEKHFAEYNTTLRPTFSVGEYWGSKEDISNWIHKTYMEGTYQSAAFDFPLQSNIREAFNNGTYQILNNAGLISDPVLKRYAVTFLDNHDTFKDLPTDGSNYNYQHRVERNIVEANAFILAMPGTPCLFYPHFMHPEWHNILCELIKARRTAGITNESERSAAVLVGTNGIQWVVTGTNGQICFQLGDATDQGVPNGFTTVWESDEVDGKRVARFSITSSLYRLIQYNTKKNLINGYPVIDRNSCTFNGSITVNVKPSSEGCKLVYTTNGQMPNVTDQAITEETALTFSETTTLKVGVVANYSVPTSSVVTRQYVKTSTVSDKLNFYVKDDNAPYIYTYYYDNEGNKVEPFGPWRGSLAYEKVTVGGLEWWHVKMDKPEYPVNLIINWEGSQTPDIDGITSDVFYTVKDGLPNDVTNIYMPMMEDPNLSIDKPTGSYENGVSAMITSSYSGATIVYTTDGTEPTTSSPTITSGSTVTFNESGNHYLRAGLVRDGEVIKKLARSYYVSGGTGNGVNIYVKNMTTNDVPHIYAWDANEQAVTASATGDVLNETETNCGQTWYKKHFDAVPAGMRFMLTGDKDKSADIKYLENGHDYYFYYYPGAHFGNDAFQPGFIDVTADSKHTTDVKAITMFMYDNGNEEWSNGIKLYPYANGSRIFWDWAESWAESAFPTTNLGGQSWFYCTFLDRDNIGAILFNGANQNERFEVSSTTSDVFMKFPIANDNWSTGENVTSNYSQYLPAVETPEEGAVTPEPEHIIPACATSVETSLHCYFENSSFGSPFAWVYSSTNTFGEHGWPGEALIEVVGTAPSGNLIYRWTNNNMFNSPSHIIFSNNGQSQVGPFEFVNGGYYTANGLVGITDNNVKELNDIKSAWEGKEYLITNDITAVVTVTDNQNKRRLFAKDNNVLPPTENWGMPVPDALQDYTYDESNWVELVLPEGSNINLDGKDLVGGTVVGKYSGGENPVLELTAIPLSSEDHSYTYNNYLVANFDMHNYDYFYIRPKAQEYSIIKYAIYRNGKLAMSNQPGDNPWDIMTNAEVEIIDDTTYWQNEIPLRQFLTEDGVYELEVICKAWGRYNRVAVVNATRIADFQEMEAITLADLLENGENDKFYRIADSLAVVDVPQNYEPFAFLSDGKDNWIRVNYPYDFYDMFQKDGFIAAGTLKATLHDVDFNPYLEVNSASIGEPFEDDVVVQRVNLAQPFTLKPNQVVDVTGYWNATDNALHAYALSSGIQDQNITLTTDWAGWGETLTDSTRYTVRAAITLKEPWHTTTTDSINTKDYDYGDFHNYIANALYWPQIAIAITGDVNGDGQVTAVDVTALYNFLLNNDDSDIVNGDQTGDGIITAADVTAVYNVLLGSRKKVKTYSSSKH